jgi:hypothetical protein
MALAAVLSIIIGFAILDDLGESLGMLSSFGIDLDGILVVYVLLYFAIDVVVALGLFFVKRWARNITIWWGVWAIITIVTSFGSPSAWLVPSILQAVSAVLVFIAGKDFAKA